MAPHVSAHGQDTLIDRLARDLGPGFSRVAQALRDVPRDIFTSSELALLAYDGKHQSVAEGHSLHPLEVWAKMLAALQIKPTDTVLEVGTGVGYSTALVSKLAARVHTVERLSSLAERAKQNLTSLGIRNVVVHIGDVSTRIKDERPFDAILVSYQCFQIPLALKDRLAIGGRLVVALGPHRDRLSLVRITRQGPAEFEEQVLEKVRFVMRLGDILVDRGVVSREDVERAHVKAQTDKARLGETIRQMVSVEESDIYQALAAQRGIKFGQSDSLLRDIELQYIRHYPRAFLEHNRVIPITVKSRVLTLATPDPDPILSDLEVAFSPLSLELCLVTPTDYRRLWSAVDLMLSGEKVTPSAAESIRPPDEQVLKESGLEAEAYFVQLFESMLLDAIGERASDIHLEQYGDRVRVRMRVDGDLRDIPRFRMTPTDLLGVINVIKIRAKLDIAEHRLPQGGRVRIKVGERTFDLRVQTQPSLYGEHAVIRLLPQDVRLLTIDDLGLSPKVAEHYRKLLDQPSGLILVVGPTGSGKTTTLYAGLQILARDLTRKVITVEDPIEYAIEGVQQTTARPEIGFAFADAMRSFVREDPDVILIGEIRDHETALEAIRASQTGHLVFSTLHCNDATDAVQRLYDLGMHPNSIASELIAVMAQRLPRRICESCRTETPPKTDLLKTIFPQGAPKDWVFYAGKGCSRCRGYGTFGRIACVELLKADSSMRSLISRQPGMEELRKAALKLGMVSMREEALDLVRRGLISLGELPVILSSERLAPEVQP